MKTVHSHVLMTQFVETVEQLAADILTLAGHPPALLEFRRQNDEIRRIHDNFVFRAASTMVINNLSKIIGWLNTNGAIREEYHCWLVAPEEDFISHLIRDETEDASLRGLLGYTYRGIRALEDSHYAPMFRLGEAFSREVWEISDCWLGKDIIYLTKEMLMRMLTGRKSSFYALVSVKEDAILASSIPVTAGKTEREQALRFFNSGIRYPLYEQDGVVMLADHTDEYLLSTEDARGDVNVYSVDFGATTFK